MAAYAALVSVMQIIDQIQRHPRPPISLHKQHSESLTKVVIFLQNFLECYNPHVSYTVEADPLESRIAEAAYAAEDVIESYIVDQIHARHKDEPGNISLVEFYQGLQKVIEEMELIKMEIVEIKEKKGFQFKKVADLGSFRRSTSRSPKVSMVGFDDVLYQMLEKVTRGPTGLQTIPIVGMGGIGKTTLAQHLYVDPLVEQYFDLRAWSTISQEYNALEILRQVLDQVGKGHKENLNEYELGEQLYKSLIGRRYLILMDDMWSIEAWDKVRIYFPDNDNGSRVVVTTRISNLASQLNCFNSLEMKFLDEASSWNLFSKIMFGEEICPLELEGIGQKIVGGCKGLPLSISVIGGLLSNTEQTRENWELVDEDLSSIVNLENNERCLQILYTSYNNLPVHIKPCFLYMGMFPQNDEILVPLLILLWVAEGFLKPCNGKSLEVVGKEYLEELLDRNLILVENRSNCGELLSFKIHDLLRDLSLREARKLKFLSVLGVHSIHDLPLRRVRSRFPGPLHTLVQSLESASLVRSLIGNFERSILYNFRLLRVWMSGAYSEESTIIYEERLLGLLNLRFLLVDVGMEFLPRVPSSISLLWNLQTVIISHTCKEYVFEIWKMPQLRHVLSFGGRFDGAYCFPDHLLTGDEVVLNNLQTLLMVRNLNLGEEVVKRIPNIMMLDLYYDYETSTRDIGGDYCLNNLFRLKKLETLSLEYSWNYQRQDTLVHLFSFPYSQQDTLAHLVTFPNSLKELTLKETRLHWEDMHTKIGMLPLLQILHLNVNAFIGSEWKTFEGQFSTLRLLLIDDCADLEYWVTDNTHFPRLEELDLRSLHILSEIPLSIGDIPTLRSIKLNCCSDSAFDSARRIQEEQEALGNEELQIQFPWYLELKNLSGP